MPSIKHQLNPEHLSLPELLEITQSQTRIELSEESRNRIEHCRNYLEEKMEGESDPIYGINTGFGSLYNISIEGKDLATLQENLVRSHACGTGDEVPVEITRLMLYLKARSLSYGHSGVRTEVVERLLYFYNEGITPVVYEQGSLGASGDLAPLAHLTLALMGEGEVWYGKKKMPASDVHEKLGIKALQLGAKEGLAMLNGTQFMLAYGVYSCLRAYKLSYLCDLIATLSLEGFDGRPEPFNSLLHAIRPHPGQIETAKRVREFLEGSELIGRYKSHVQDPYSFRCIPQVHGATKDALRYISGILEVEMNAVTDNPTIFPEQDMILSGGNFHGQNLALALDQLAICTAELASISERRTYLLISGQRDLPAFLVASPGLNSGLMIAQYTAASIVSQNKQLCTPASVDSIVSSNGQEDHVSMGANAATKALRVVENLEKVLAIELIAASQALFFRDDKTSAFLMEMLDNFREVVPFLEKDRILAVDIANSRDFILNLEIEKELIFSV